MPRPAGRSSARHGSTVQTYVELVRRKGKTVGGGRGKGEEQKEEEEEEQKEEEEEEQEEERSRKRKRRKSYPPKHCYRENIVTVKYIIFIK